MNPQPDGQRSFVLRESNVDRAESAMLLDGVEGLIRRFCVLPDDHCLTAVTL